MVSCVPVFLHKSRRRNAHPPEMVKDLFQTLAGGRERIGATELARFLSGTQGESHADQEYAVRLISKFHSVWDSRQRCQRYHHGDLHIHDSNTNDEARDNAHLSGLSTTLDVMEFLDFLLLSDLNNAFQVSDKPTQDMSWPLSHYFIYCSHNSYLTGNQLTSKCSTAPIVKALRDGYRVIELDCWERKGEIMVLHGNTLTKAVPFEECIKAIKENAFVASRYPVILTIENHLPEHLQKKATQLMKEVFGEALFLPPPEDRPPRQFSSPEELKNRILISDTPPKDTLPEQAAADPETVVEVVPELISSPPYEDDSPPLSPTGIRYRVKKKITKHVEEAANAWRRVDHNHPSDKDVQPTAELDQLIYISCVKPSEMEDAPVKGQLCPGERSIMANVSEPQIRKFINKNADSLIEYCKNNLGRMYPFGLRFDSSNADPFLAWSHGFQLAALNSQGGDRPCWLARAMFDGNGRCGYVKKPDVLLPGSGLTLEQISAMAAKVQLKVTVLMGTDWHKMLDFFKKPDLYVKLAIDGIPADVGKKRTTTIFRSFEPTWEDQTFEFFIRVPEMAILRIEVWDHDKVQRDDFVGQACFFIPELKVGIRSIPLNSREGEPIKAKLLCFIEKHDIPFASPVNYKPQST
ncbi:hypothetical protein KP509_16G021800 [Ceratopteris richardii]|uniref:Phosphoinositide phospholipase C n=1 Tax=Ceratopteris richardii TaxID=49495 RepID=A0A8T2SX80_CERRI|nr:hypothetical protein KP509_16G021800 [Ceratopteris richardii]KAH7387410.1 hypothetical protein KP509_16G021800 [Ceratopteris richardii]KAH7387411.1 hypothetical protein KP509_16G021800 [Ceratopteris richardii]